MEEGNASVSPYFGGEWPIRSMLENSSVGAKGLRKRSHYALVAGLGGCFVRLELTDENLFIRVSINFMIFISAEIFHYHRRENAPLNYYKAVFVL